jgi:hypothetical protein
VVVVVTVSAGIWLPCDDEPGEFDRIDGHGAQVTVNDAVVEID